MYFGAVGQTISAIICVVLLRLIRTQFRRECHVCVVLLVLSGLARNGSNICMVLNVQSSTPLVVVLVGTADVGNRKAVTKTH